jgi:polysaccharide biosynthesis protein PslG
VAAAYRLDPELGVQWHGMWAYYTDQQRETVLGQLVQSNVHLVRMDVSWAMLQPTNGTTYDPWGVGFVDRVINMINARGMTAMITFWLTPGWANGNRGDRVPPTNPADYARAAQWAANRYAGKVASWEVWNEPNSNDFFVGASPVTYTNLLKAAYPAIKAGDPKARVVFGGLQYNDDAWVAKCYDAGVKGAFDVMSTHAYQGVANQSPLAPDNGMMWRYTHLVAIRNLMVARGDGAKPIWSGMGYSTHVDQPTTPPWFYGVSEVTQAIYLNQAVNLARQQWPWLEKWFWYTARDEDGGENYHERHYGLLRSDLSTKPALTALYDLTLPVAPA